MNSTNETKSLAINTGAQLAGKAISTVLGLVAIAIMTRYLGAEKFGWYATAIGFLQFIGIFIDFGFGVVSAKMLSEPNFDKTALTNNLFTWRLITALVSQGLLPLTIFFFPYPAPVKLAVLIMAISFISVSLNQIFVARLQTTLRLYWQAFGEIISRITLVGGIILVARGNYGFLPMMTAITIASIIYSLILWRKSGRYHWSIDWPISRAIWHNIWPTAVAVLFNSIYLQGDRLLLPLFVTPADTGYYTAAYRVLDILIQMVAMLIGLMMPLMAFAWSRDLKEKFHHQYQRAFDIISLILLPMIFGIFILAEPIMIFIAGQEFAPAGRMLAFLIWAIFGATFGMIFGHINLAINRQKTALWAYIITAIAGLIGYLIFIPRLGVMGAAYVTIFTELLAMIILAGMAVRFSGIRPRFQVWSKIILACLLMTGALHALKDWPILALVVIGALVYGATIFALKTISWTTLQEIFSREK